jgi:formylglycine-generating enzyme required for sulfatase activity
MAAAQCPSVHNWLREATEIKPGVWIANAEVSVRDYEAFEWYMNKDSGEAMYHTLLPPSKFHFLDHLPWSSFNEGHFPIEVDHPIAGIVHWQADEYCKWFSIFLMKTQLDYHPNVGYWEQAENFPEIRFRLPTPEEWNLAKSKIVAPKKTMDYQELPSRYLHTRTVTSSRPGEKLLHLQDNVSEMTSDPNVVMGGNFAAEGLEISSLNGGIPDQKMGFRIVLTFTDSMRASYPKIPNSEFNNWKDYTPYAKPRDQPIKIDPKHRQSENEYYPYNLKKNWIEIEPNIWLSKTDVTVGQFAYYMYFCVSDSGTDYANQQSPQEWTYTYDNKVRLLSDSLNEALPQQVHLPMRGVSQKQAETFCKWMTVHHVFEVSPPGVTCRYRFRLLSETELELAMKMDPTVTPKATEMGFRYVVEVMPTHPDAVHFKAVPEKFLKRN